MDVGLERAATHTYGSTTDSSYGVGLYYVSRRIPPALVEASWSNKNLKVHAALPECTVATDEALSSSTQ